MRPAYTILPAVAAIGAAASQPSDSWVFGNSLFYLGPPSGNSHITKATYSILPPSVPSGSTVSNKNDEVWVSVWVGASSTAGDDNANLYQPLFNWSPDQESQYVELRHKKNTDMALTNKIPNIEVALRLRTSGASLRAPTLQVRNSSRLHGLETMKDFLMFEYFIL
jgi:hypothetical protein